MIPSILKSLIPWSGIINWIDRHLSKRWVRVTLAAVGLFLAGGISGYIVAQPDAPDTDEGTVTDTVRVERDIRDEETRGRSRPSTLELFDPLVAGAELEAALLAKTVEALRDSLTQLARRNPTVTDTVILAPVDLGTFNLARPEPVSVGSQQVTYTSFNPTTTQWERRTYEVPEPTWKYDVSLGAGFDPLRWDRGALDVFAELQYRSVGLFARPALGLSAALRADPRLIIGLRYHIWDR